MRPELKSVAWERLDGNQVRLVFDVREQLVFDDPDGSVEHLLTLLREGGRTASELAQAMSISIDDLTSVLGVLNDYRLLEDRDLRHGFEPGERERYFSNLSFFESFATLTRSREDFQRRLRAAHVLVLGTGGLNSNTVPHLCGLGVGRITLLDRDRVEARNFARQYLYRWSDLGQRKVERAAAWVRAFDPTIDVDCLNADVASVGDVEEYIGRFQPDVVMSGIDSPAAVDGWVNEACVRAGVPYVRGGMWVTQGIVWSVDPGRSACLECTSVNGAELSMMDPTVAVETAGTALFTTKPRANRGIGPVAGLIGALCSFEILRYLTQFEPPTYAGKPISIDFAQGCVTQQVDWQRRKDCVVCGTVSDTDR